MSLTLRNLFLLASLCVLISSVSISRAAYNHRNTHRVNPQEYSSQPSHYQQTPNNVPFATNIQTIVTSISSSIQPNVPSIIPTQNLPTFTFSRSTCESSNADQKKQPLDQVKKTKDSIQSFKTKAQDPRVLSDADNSFKYLTVLEELANYKCSDLNNKNLLIGPTPYQTNLNSQRAWIYGGLKKEDLVKAYTERITKYNNVTNCGLDTPFWDGLKCISCFPPTPVFNIATSKCEACPAGASYDSISHTCIACEIGNVFNPDTGKCEPIEPLKPALIDLFNAIL